MERLEEVIGGYVNIFKKLWNILENQYAKDMARLEAKHKLEKQHKDFEEIIEALNILMDSKIDQYEALKEEHSKLEDYRDELLEQIEKLKK